jgi:hypothetical protein
MDLIDTERAVQLYQALGSAVEMSGGSAANTMCGVASFGGAAAYLGKVSDDELGRVFGHDLLAVGVQFRPGNHIDEVPTGRCIIVVTPDAERTMNTYLGASSLYCAADVDDAAVANGRVLYMEGYLYDRPEAKEAFRHAAVSAHDAGAGWCRSRSPTRSASTVTATTSCRSWPTRSTSCSATRPSCWRSTRPTRSTRRSPSCGGTARSPRSRRRQGFDRHRRRRRRAGAARPGPQGDRHHRRRRPLRRRLPVRPHVGRPLDECGQLGSIAAAEVISHVGPRPLVELKSLI